MTYKKGSIIPAPNMLAKGTYSTPNCIKIDNPPKYSIVESIDHNDIHLFFP